VCPEPECAWWDSLYALSQHIWVTNSEIAIERMDGSEPLVTRTHFISPRTFNRAQESQDSFRSKILSLASCYFAHNSSVFSVLLRFRDAQSGHSFHPCNMDDIHALALKSGREVEQGVISRLSSKP
jgi:hypothetical protein